MKDCKNLTKTECEVLHAKRRCLERVGVELSKTLRREIVGKIQSGKLQVVRKQSNRVTVFRHTLNEREFDIVYDNKRHRIVTFLYPEIEGEPYVPVPERPVRTPQENI
jgi:hypothetical protein